MTNGLASMKLPDWLSRQALAKAQSVALESPTTQMTYDALRRNAVNVAEGLRRYLEKDAFVAVLMKDGLTYATTVHAVIQAQLRLIPLNFRLSAGELAWQLQDAGVGVLVTDALGLEQAQSVAQEANHAISVLHFDALTDTIEQTNVTAQTEQVVGRTHIDLDDVQAMLYTSGTTGRPKGALITYGNHWWAASGSAIQIGLDVSDRWLVPMPLFHVGGLGVLMRSLIYGTTAVIHNQFDAARVNAALDEDDITIVSLVPTMLQRLLDDRGQRPFSPRLRCILLGGSSVPQSLLEQAHLLGAPICQSYGLTESNAQMCTLEPSDSLRKVGSSGRPLMPMEVAIVKDGVRVDFDCRGEILVRGPTVTIGYHQRPEVNAVAFDDGWFHTGDEGYLDEEGFLYVLDRRSDLIVSGGENIYPAEVESALMLHPEVLEAGVVAMEDAQWGQVPVAFVVPRRDGQQQVSVDDLISHCKSRLAHYKVPKRVIFVNELPRNASGKLLRKNLRLWPKTDP